MECGDEYVAYYTGNRVVKLEIAIASKDRDVRSKGAKRGRMSDLEAKLDELRRDLSSTGSDAIFPHAVLTAQQISLLSSQKPTTPAEVRFEFDASCAPPLVCIFCVIYKTSTSPAARKGYREGEDKEVRQQDH
jgi:hypothetical protein